MKALFSYAHWTLFPIQVTSKILHFLLSPKKRPFFCLFLPQKAAFFSTFWKSQYLSNDFLKKLAKIHK